MAKNLTDLPGIGEKTERDLRKSFRGDRATSRIGKELSVNEVSSVTSRGEGGLLDVKLDKNQKESLASEIGRSVGGVVGSSRERSGSGSKIPDGFKRQGEFLFESGQRKEAFQEFNDLSQDRQEADRAERARVTTDLEEWEDNKSGLDFPGVDTPNRKPREKDKDLGFSIHDL
jgi:hypothetical protein